MNEKLFRKVSKLNEAHAKQPIKTWARACTIIPEFVGHTFEVHNGNKFLKVFVTGGHGRAQAGRIFADADFPRSQRAQGPGRAGAAPAA